MTIQHDFFAPGTGRNCLALKRLTEKQKKTYEREGIRSEILHFQLSGECSSPLLPLGRLYAKTAPWKED
jgi:hypothetical protein